MKRSGLKRGSSKLSREKPLGAKAEKVREFMQRAREKSNLTRVELARRPRVRPQEGPLDPRSWQLAVFASSGGRCIISGARARDADDPRFHAHHPLPKRTLRDRGLHAHVWDPRNGAWIRSDLHEHHESPGVRPEHRIGRAALPPAVWEFCAELDALDGTQWATALVERLHPAAGISGSNTRRA